MAELEKLEKDSRDKNRKFERKNADLLQTNKRLESRNKLLLDEVNSLVRRHFKYLSCIHVYKHNVFLSLTYPYNWNFGILGQFCPSIDI